MYKWIPFTYYHLILVLFKHRGSSAKMSILRNIITLLFGPSNGPQVYHEEHLFELLKLCTTSIIYERKFCGSHMKLNEWNVKRGK
jgi:hypothetical protein